MKVLVVAAHPDDESLGCGGTIARHAAAGDDVQLLFVADGERARLRASDEDVQRRLASARQASQVLGASRSPIFLNFPDNRLDSVPLLDIVRSLEHGTSVFQPDIVYTHHAGDLNVDHEIVNRVTLTVFRPLPASAVSGVYGFEVLSSSNWREPERSFCPNYFVDIEATFPTKLKALRCYGSEMREFPHARSFEAVDALARFRGAQYGLACAEAFIVLRQIARSPG